MLVDSKLKEKEARREERKQKREQQFAAVLNERLRIETTRRQRHGSLAELERRATEKCMRMLATTSSKARAEVAHALGGVSSQGGGQEDTLEHECQARQARGGREPSRRSRPRARETQRVAKRRHERRKCEEAAARGQALETE